MANGLTESVPSLGTPTLYHQVFRIFAIFIKPGKLNFKMPQTQRSPRAWDYKHLERDRLKAIGP
jgi:hypothetical protein